jgi:hypothetical protein
VIDGVERALHAGISFRGVSRRHRSSSNLEMLHLTLRRES